MSGIIQFGPIHHGNPKYQLGENYQLMLTYEFVRGSGNDILNTIYSFLCFFFFSLRLSSLYVILITQGSFPRCLFPQQVVSELMVVCGEGGEVFMVPTQWGQRKSKRPTHKDPREGKKKKPTK